MFDSNSLLIIIISVLTAQSIVFSIFILFLVKDIRKAVEKVNNILETIDTTAQKLTEPIMSARGALGAINEGLKVAGLIKKLLRNNNVSQEN
jgi:hypothetical protein